ncbi:YfcE family phosphodiesterase [Deltaproteobacteria bacterium Smac51]|nr:YfcE family phosphodiesterase [Deltaproteobacteria bacterium Smac51]
MKYAFISDIHGNTPALAAVLMDIERRKVRAVWNLGDTLFGPLDPHGTFNRLNGKDIVHIRGNGDRELSAPDDGASTTMNNLRRNLSDEERVWLKKLPAIIETDEILAFHGSPDSDERYFLESVSESGVYIKSAGEIEEALKNRKASLVVCGHSHLPRIIQIPGGPLVINAGSVGLPAYHDDLPADHSMESGSPHAKYVLAEKRNRQWAAEIIHLPYDWAKSAEMAMSAGRRDWAAWLATGIAPVKPI